VIPVALRTARLVLDAPGEADIPGIAEYCTDPLFERFLTTPWPYTRADAEYFVRRHAPTGWTDGSELTWAIRAGGRFAGMIGLRTPGHDVGFWMGAPHRGNGYLVEALGAVCDYAFDTLGWDHVRWEAFPGNVASAASARAAGFAYTGVAPSHQPTRDGEHPPGWHGILRAGDDRSRRPGWPIP
jgi:Acetyltransferases, including N-acetylases of ribosomal proteins